jgi:hypothetical protein
MKMSENGLELSLASRKKQADRLRGKIHVLADRKDKE